MMSPRRFWDSLRKRFKRLFKRPAASPQEPKLAPEEAEMHESGAYQEEPLASPVEDLRPEGLRTPIIQIFMRLERAEINTQTAIDELLRLAKIAGTAAARAALRDLLSKLLDRSYIEPQDYVLYELKVQKVADEYPAEPKEKPKEKSKAPPPKKDGGMSQEPHPPIEPDDGNDDSPIIGGDTRPPRKVVRRHPVYSGAIAVAGNESDNNSHGLLALLGVLGLVALGVIVLAIAFHDDGGSNAPIFNNVGQTSPLQGNPATNGGNTNGGGSPSGSPSKLIAGEVDSDGNGIADETRRDLGMLPGDGTCPTDDAVQAALGGLTVHWISGCLFKWNSNNVDFVQRTCPQGWYCTLDMGADNVAWKGDGTIRRFEGGSFWPLADKTFANECVYLRHENVYAGIVGDPPTLAGNLKCDDQAANPSAGTLPPANASSCMISSSDDAAKLIGGSAANWAQLEPGVFKYRNKGTFTAGFKHPGGTGRLDYWGNNKPEALTSAGEVPYPQDEMTFHCNPKDS